MKRFSLLDFGLIIAALLGLNLTMTSAAPIETGKSSAKIRVLLVYGGHDFETNQFFQVFEQNPAMTFHPVHHSQAGAWFKPERGGEYDVMVFYDMWQPISEEDKRNLLDRLRQGKGLLALHHSLCSYQDWEQYAALIGGKYHLQKWSDHGVEKPASTYQHDVDFKVHIEDPSHPVTRGLTDFSIHDEVYGGTETRPNAHVLLTTDEPRNGKNLGWTTDYGAARIVYLQLGHDHQAYQNPNYRRLVQQAIAWVAKPISP
jgi:type 1 glutamine amidotransferase